MEWHSELYNIYIAVILVLIIQCVTTVHETPLTCSENDDNNNAAYYTIKLLQLFCLFFSLIFVYVPISFECIFAI